MTNKQKSIVAMLLSTLSFSFMGLFVKMAGDLPSPQKLVFRCIAIMAVSFILMQRQKVKLREIKHHKWLLLRSFFGTVGIICNYYAIDHMILSDSTIIFRMTTIILLITSWIFLKEKVNTKQFGAIAIAFIGVVFVVKPEFSVEVIPYLIALMGAMFAAFAYTTLRVLGQKEHYLAIVFYFAAFSFVIVTPYVLFTFVPMTVAQLVFLILGGVAAAGGQFGVTVAYKYAPAKEVSIYNYLGVVFSAVMSIVVFWEFPDVYSWIGYGVIFGSAYYMYRLNNRTVEVVEELKEETETV